jgi:hypothetical protein
MILTRTMEPTTPRPARITLMWTWGITRSGMASSASATARLTLSAMRSISKATMVVQHLHSVHILASP